MVRQSKMRPSRETIGERRLVHGHSVGRGSTLTYRSWKSMKQRCLNPTNPAYATYGAKGISVCDRWRAYPAFLADMGERPSVEFTLDRIDNTRGYEPGNCRWADRKEQRRNQPRNRPVRRSDGVIFRTMAEAAEATGANDRHIRDCCVGTNKTHRGFGWEFVE